MPKKLRHIDPKTPLALIIKWVSYLGKYSKIRTRKFCGYRHEGGGGGGKSGEKKDTNGFLTSVFF